MSNGRNASAARRKCSSDPPKREGSVSTDTAQAPPCAYALTRDSTSLVCADRSPAEGECSLHSAITSNPSGESFNLGGAGSSHTRAHNASSDSLARASSSLLRLACAISVRKPDIVQGIGYGLRVSKSLGSPAHAIKRRGTLACITFELPALPTPARLARCARSTAGAECG